ncbi:hypothetical protein [Bacillus cereus]|uniref:hypothetical protein n=1 Tax=Bacillus cereus TaxID=1396 RepID=UPI000BF6F55D|nr:hypothetical protein [Bacillus cereus]PFQ31495.1 hypothetical protein COK16_00035 [Bacillus cereus]
MKNILKFVVKHLSEVIVLIYVVLVKLTPLHSYLLWYRPQEFGVYTTALNNFVVGNAWKIFGLLMLVGNIALIVKLYKLQKEVGDADKPKPQTRSERHKRSVK